MKFKALVAMTIAGLALVACADFETLQNRHFSHELGQRYTQLSINNELSKDKGAEYFATKARSAYAGNDVQPETPDSWNVPAEYRPELKNAYDMLQIALLPDRKKIEKPIAAADAQVAFDCWTGQAHQHWVANSNENDCRAAFYQSFCRMYNGKCSSAIPSDHIFRVFFASRSFALDVKGRDTVLKVAEVFNKGAKEVIVAGHADRIGDDDRNMRLSADRANAVKARLVLAGIPEDKITVKAFGEKMPLVQTRKNKPNASNRRVLIVVR